MIIKEMNAVKVSVIIPVYNAGSRITACLDSLRNQTMDNPQIILVDDHGYDNSVALAREYADLHPEMNIVFLDNGRNLGPGGAKNNGLSTQVGNTSPSLTATIG